MDKYKDAVVLNITGAPCESNTFSCKSKSPDTYYILSFFASGIGFLADAYDFFVIDSVFDIIKNTAVSRPQDAHQNMVVTATLAGAVIGQIGFGLGADFIGRRQMFLITSALVTLGSLGSAVVGFGYQHTHYTFSIYHQLMIFRFILGVGIGGEYPLSASMSMESLETEETHADEQKGNGCLWFLRQKPNSLAAVFSLQGVGLLLSSLVIMLSLSLNFSLESTWRFCLALGAVPSAVAFYLRWKMHESTAFKRAAKRFDAERDSCSTETSEIHGKQSNVENVVTHMQAPEVPTVVADSLEATDTSNNSNISLSFFPPHALEVSSELARSKEPHYSMSRYRKHCQKSRKMLYSFRYALLGSSLSWFLIDVTLYGVASYKTDLSRLLLHQSGVSQDTSVVTSPFATADRSTEDYYRLSTERQEKLRSDVFKRTEIAFLFTLLGLPGYIMSIFFIHKPGLKTLQLSGFYGISCVFLIMSFLHLLHWNTLYLDIALLGLTFFFSNFGPNTTTYILPTHLYPTIIRATCHGFSAAMGKVGAVLGTILVKFVETRVGLKYLFLLCSFVSILGAVVTHFLVKSDSQAKEIQQTAERLNVQPT